MKNKFILRSLGIALSAMILLSSAGCNPNEELLEENAQGEQFGQENAESGSNEAGDTNIPSGTVSNQGGGTDSGSAYFEEDDPDQAVSSDGTVPQQPDGNQQVDGSNGEGGASEDGSLGESGAENSTPPNEGEEEIVPSEPSEGESEPIVYDEALAKEYEDYLAMDMMQQKAFHETFESPSAFREWREAAQAAYDAKQAANSVTGGSVNLYDYVKGNS